MQHKWLVATQYTSHNHQYSTKLDIMAQNDEVKLLGLWVSPFSHRVEWALKLKGVDYEYSEQDVFNKSPLLLELNPITKKIPVLVHNGKVMIESLLLIEYIDETWTQNPLLPQDPYQRAMARFWAKFGDEKVLQEAFSALLVEGEEKERKVKRTIEGLERLETELKDKRWFGGDNVGYLDLALGWISYWLPVWEEVGSVRFVDPTKFPSIVDWMSNFVNHPVINDGDALPIRDMMIDYLQTHVKHLPALNRGSN